MKLKGSVKKLTPTLLMGISGVVFVLFLILRFYQLVMLTDSQTGFFTDKSNPTVALFYAIAIGFVLIMLILSFLGNGIKPLNGIQKNIPFAFMSVIFAGVLAYDTVKELSSSFAQSRSVAGLIRDNGMLTSLSYVFALLTVAVLLVNGICFMTGSNLISKMKLCMLFPVLWAFTQSIGFFSITASYLKVTQLLLTIFGYVFFMIFLFEYARQISGISAKDSTAMFFATALISAFLLLSVALPNLVFSLFFNGEHIVASCPEYIYTLFAGLFAAVSVIPFVKQKNNIPVAEFSETQENATEN